MNDKVLIVVFIIFGGAFLFFYNIGWILTYSFTGTIGAVDKKLSNQYHYGKGKSKIIYFRLGNWFELGSEEMKVNEPKEFKVLARSYAKTKTQVFYNQKQITEADPESFEILWGFYTRDKDNIYYMSEEIVKNCNDREISDLKVRGDHGEDMLKCNGKVFKYSDQIMTNDAENFERIDNWFSKDSAHIYYQLVAVKNVDVKSFQPLRKDHAYIGMGYDKDGLIFKGKKYVLDNPEKVHWHPKNNSFLVNKDTLYTVEYGDVLKKFDAAPLSEIEFLEKGFLRIGNKVFNGKKEIIGAKAGKFRSISYALSSDGENYFYHQRQISNPVDNIEDLNLGTGYIMEDGTVKIDYNNEAKSVKVTDNFAEWNGKIFFSGEMLPGVTEDTINIIHPYNYWSWSNKVYYRTEEIKGADSATFEYDKDLDAVSFDKNQVYWFGKKINNLKSSDREKATLKWEYLDYDLATNSFEYKGPL